MKILEQPLHEFAVQLQCATLSRPIEMRLHGSCKAAIKARLCEAFEGKANVLSIEQIKVHP